MLNRKRKKKNYNYVFNKDKFWAHMGNYLYPLFQALIVIGVHLCLKWEGQASHMSVCNKLLTYKNHGN